MRRTKKKLRKQIRLICFNNYVILFDYLQFSWSSLRLCTFLLIIDEKAAELPAKNRIKRMIIQQIASHWQLLLVFQEEFLDSRFPKISNQRKNINIHRFQHFASSPEPKERKEINSNVSTRIKSTIIQLHESNRLLAVNFR